MSTGSRTLTKLFRRHVAQTSGAPLGLDIVAARGSWVQDRSGRRFLDLVAGMGVATLGHRHPDVVRACAAQLRRYLHVMVYGEYVLEPQVRFAARLAALAGRPFETAFFTSSGAEAIEGALKLARKHTGRRGLVAFDLGYHGDTLGALSIGGNRRYRDPFLPLLPGARLLPWNDGDALTRIDDTVAAVVIEPVQAEGGVRIPSTSFLRALRERCSATGALLVFDEVVTGLGRIGQPFAFQHFGVRPDVLVLAKAIGGGLPLGAFMSSRRIMSALARRPPLSHVTTFGGHPLACAAGLATLDVVVRQNLSERARRMGDAFRSGLTALQRRHPVVQDVRGIGLLVAIELRSAAATRRFAAACLARGLVLNWTLHRDTVIRLAPPLTITRGEMRYALARIDDALAEAEGRRGARESTRVRRRSSGAGRPR